MHAACDKSGKSLRTARKPYIVVTWSNFEIHPAGDRLPADEPRTDHRGQHSREPLRSDAEDPTP